VSRDLSRARKMIGWTSLEGVGNSRALKSSYIWIVMVPIAARMAEKFDGEVAVTLFGASITVSLSLPFTWQIFYLSAVLFSLANLIYTVRCPIFLKETPRLTELVAYGRGIPFLDAYLTDWKRIVRGEDPKWASARTAVDQAQAAGAKSSDRYLAGCFSSTREFVNAALPLSRSACFAMYVCGFLLLGWVFIENFAYVYRAWIAPG